MRVERIAHGVGVPVLRQIDMRDLPARVHAGVGAPGALHQSFSPDSASIAAVKTPCTVSPSAWICQPQNGAPSYSMVSL